MPDLTIDDREALEAALHRIDSSDRGGIPQGFYDRLIALRDACPEPPALEDGIYEVPDEDGVYYSRYVRDGHFSHYLTRARAILAVAGIEASDR